MTSSKLWVKRDGNVYVWGFKEVTDESQFIDSILSGKKEIKLATHVLQFVFLGFTGRSKIPESRSSLQHFWLRHHKVRQIRIILLLHLLPLCL
jgi:hypothetical protein